MNPLDPAGDTSLPHIERAVGALSIPPSDNLNMVRPDSVCVAAVKLALKPYGSLEEYVEDMNSYVSDAVNRRAHLVCFPAYSGLLSASIDIRAWNTASRLFTHAHGLPDVSGVYEALKKYSEQLFEVFFHTMSLLAAKHRVYIMAGTTLYFHQGQLRHGAFLFNHRGELVGTQEKLSLTPLELELNLEAGSELKAFETAFGPVSVLIGSDNAYYELGRIARGLGVRLLLNPACYPGRYAPTDAALGINMRAQENRVLGVQSTMAGDLGLGFTLTGPAGIYAPYDLTKHQMGIVSQTDTLPVPELACARLDLDRLDIVKNPYFQDRNLPFLERYIDRIY